MNVTIEKTALRTHGTEVPLGGGVLAGIVVLGFLLRLVGLRFGLPELYHADEPIVVNHAMAYGTGDLNPHFFQIPPLVSYLLFVAYSGYFVAGFLVGKFSGPGVFADLFLTDPTSFYLLGRFLLGTLAGTATLIAVYALAKRVTTQRAALWAAAFMSVCFLHVRDSHYIYTDIPLCLALVVAAFFAMNLYDRGVARDYVTAGVWVGICASLKYNAALMAGAYLTAHLLRKITLREKLFSRSFWLGLGACAAAFFITNPLCLFDFSFFCRSVAKQGQAQAFVGWYHHLSYSLVGGMGGYALAAALAGILLAFYLGNVRAWILLGFVLPFYLGITLYGQVHDRYVLPLIPFLAVFLGLLVDWILQQVRESLKTWLGVGFALFLVFPMFVKSAYSDWLFLQPDSRTLAKQWIEANVPAGTKIALDHTFYVPKLLPTVEQLREKLEQAKTKEASSSQKQKRLERWIQIAGQPAHAAQKRYNLYFLSDEPENAQGYLFAEPRIPYDFEKLRKEGIQVVVTHRLSAFKPHFSFFAQVEQHCKDAQRFSPYRAVWRDFSMEPDVRTGGAFLWPEMLARRSNGEFVLVYLLEP